MSVAPRGWRRPSPNASGSCTATVTEPLVGVGLADLHDHVGTGRWLGRVGMVGCATAGSPPPGRRTRCGGRRRTGVLCGPGGPRPGCRQPAPTRPRTRVAARQPRRVVRPRGGGLGGLGLLLRAAGSWRRCSDAAGSVGVPVGASVIDRLAARIALGILALTSVGAPLALASAADAEPSSSAHAAAATHQIDAAPLRPAPTSALRSRIPPISCGPARRSGASPTRDQATGRTGPRSPR